MFRNYTLEYWKDDSWYVGKLKEIPGIFSQGETLNELEENIKDAYKLMLEEPTEIHPNTKTKEIAMEVA
ncbi:type II toxin-antitoxin system HicB family antitoxin [Deltaproteobacteria bacterium TL4]